MSSQVSFVVALTSLFIEYNHQLLYVTIEVDIQKD
jgi:hypothetical protein